ncbi:MAG: DUF5677 domain-containing protein [Acholeplasma sp.]|nr:DUF5677 domain-containing protein [Acholeplasma sp.]
MDSINQLISLTQILEQKENLKKLDKYFLSHEFIYIFITNLKVICNNLISIDALIKIDQFEDAMSIFRKYIETYLLLLSVLENPTIASIYAKHNFLIGQRACGKDTENIEKLIRNNPKNFLEYGYLEKLINNYDSKTSLSMSDVARAAKKQDFHRWYKVASNFMHNSLVSTKTDKEHGIERLNEWMSTSVSYLVNRVSSAIIME